MTPDEILKAFDNIRVWQRGGQRAPHKPLLILMALGSLARGEKPRAEFAEIEGKLGRLLEEFWPLPLGSNAKRHFPFRHLATDKLWQLDGPAAILARPPSATPTIGELRASHVGGGFPPEIQAAFQNNPALAYHDAAIQLPRSSSYLPRAEFLDWHEDQIFKKPGRNAN